MSEKKPFYCIAVVNITKGYLNYVNKNLNRKFVADAEPSNFSSREHRHRVLLIPGTGNGERGTGNGERGTGNGEPGTGVWERVYSGNPHKNSKWRTKSRKRVWKLILNTRSAG